MRLQACLRACVCKLTLMCSARCFFCVAPCAWLLSRARRKQRRSLSPERKRRWDHRSHKEKREKRKEKREKRKEKKRKATRVRPSFINVALFSPPLTHTHTHSPSLFQCAQNKHQFHLPPIVKQPSQYEYGNRVRPCFLPPKSDQVHAALSHCHITLVPSVQSSSRSRVCMYVCVCVLFQVYGEASRTAASTTARLARSDPTEHFNRTSIRSNVTCVVELP